MVQNCASHSLTLCAGVQESFQLDTNPKWLEASSQVLNKANRSAIQLPSDVWFNRVGESWTKKDFDGRQPSAFYIRTLHMYNHWFVVCNHWFVSQQRRTNERFGFPYRVRFRMSSLGT